MRGERQAAPNGSKTEIGGIKYEQTQPASRQARVHRLC
nr:MAG TPA: hypothetical protein [Bacteriophage sp.]